ncbi:MAG: hypothetical protein JF614_14675 [Acidobacteria bacterium]|nr:hypothetical protein [Acidobacteriota bacterium]
MGFEGEDLRRPGQSRMVDLLLVPAVVQRRDGPARKTLGITRRERAPLDPEAVKRLRALVYGR